MTEERHQSPDGKLTLIVERLNEADDYAIGFDGFPWHTHPDLLAGHYRLSEEAAVRRFIDDLLADRLSVVVERHDGRVADVFVSFDPSSEADGLPEGVTVELRLWNDLDLDETEDEETA